MFPPWEAAPFPGPGVLHSSSRLSGKWNNRGPQTRVFRSVPECKGPDRTALGSASQVEQENPQGTRVKSPFTLGALGAVRANTPHFSWNKILPTLRRPLPCHRKHSARTRAPLQMLIPWQRGPVRGHCQMSLRAGVLPSLPVAGGGSSVLEHGKGRVTEQEESLQQV